MAIIYQKQRQQFFERDGTPLAFGRVSFFDMSTDALKNIYLSPVEDANNVATNPHRLDAGGFVREGGVWLGTGVYKVVVERFTGLDANGDPTFEEYYEEPNVLGSNQGSSSVLSEVTIDNAVDLRNLNAGAYDVVYCTNHTSSGDTGGGVFDWVSTSTLSDDNGSVFSPIGNPSSGRWVRRFNDSKLLPSQFGAFADDDTLTLSGNFGNLESYAKLHPETSHIYIPRGDYYINGSITFSGDITVEMEAGVYFKNNLAGSAEVNITCTDCIIHGTEQMCDPYAVSGPTTIIRYNPVNRDRPVIPEWWGIESDINQTSTFEWDALFASVTAPRTIRFLNGNEYKTNARDLDFREYTLEFTNDSGLILGSRTYNFGPIITNQDTPCITWDENDVVPTAITFLGDTAVMDWFNVGTSPVDSTKYDRLLDYLLTTGPFHLIWEHTDYTFTSAVTSSVEELTHEIKGGVITTNADVEFGTVLSCVRGGFSSASTGYPRLYSNINIDWFGAVPNTSASTADNNHLALKKALQSAGVSSTIAKFNSNYIVGNGTYYLKNGVDYTSINTTDRVSFRDIGFFANNNSTPVDKGVLGDFMIYLDATEVGLYNVAYRETSSTTEAFGVTSTNLIVDNCDMASSKDDSWCVHHFGSNGYTRVTNSTFRSSASGYGALNLTNDSVDVNGCSFGPMYSTNTATAVQEGVTIDAEYLTFNNNSWVGLDTNVTPYRLGSVGLTANESIEIIGNKFASTACYEYGHAQGNVSGNSWKETEVEITASNKTITGNNFVQTSANRCFLLLKGSSNSLFTCAHNTYKSLSIPASLQPYVQITGTLSVYSVLGSYLGNPRSAEGYDAWDAGYQNIDGSTR